MRTKDTKNKLLNDRLRKQFDEEKRKNLELSEEIGRQGELIKELKFINKELSDNKKDTHIPKLPDYKDIGLNKDNSNKQLGNKITRPRTPLKNKELNLNSKLKQNEKETNKKRKEDIKEEHEVNDEGLRIISEEKTIEGKIIRLLEDDSKEVIFSNGVKRITKPNGYSIV